MSNFTSEIMDCIEPVTITTTKGDNAECPLGLPHDSTRQKMQSDCESSFEGSRLVKEEEGVEKSREMIREEQKAKRAAKKIESDRKALLEREQEQLQKEKWYTHLQSLLSRSQLYERVLTKKIEQQKKAKEEMRAKRLQMMEEPEDPSTSLDNTPPRKRRKTARRLELSPQEIENMAPMTPPPPKATSQSELGKQPASFIGQMREYQIEGYEWLATLYENGMNGILADEMGLGKTIQAIALIASLIERKIKGPFLVVGPLSTLGNWISEFQRFTPTIRTVLFRGSKDDRKLKTKEIARTHVVVTNYDLIMNDKELLSQFRWTYIIVDEGHRLKNPDCLFIKALKTYKSENRLLLTGTPLQNNLVELWSLLNFLMPDLFDDLNVFQSWFDVSAMEEEGGNAEIIAQEREKRVIATLHQILTPFLLRRTKADVNLNLPPKKEVIVYAQMTPLEAKYYKASLDKSIKKLLGVDKEFRVDLEEFDGATTGLKRKRSCRRQINYKTFCELDDSDEEEQLERAYIETMETIKRNEEENRVQKVTSQIRLKLGSIMMHLKKIVTHPYLLEYPLTEDGEYLVDENLVNHSGKLRVLDCLLKEMKTRGHRVLIFSQMTMLLDILHDYCVMRDYKFCRLDGRMSLTERDQNIADFNNDAENFIFLISTRAGGLGINLASADTVVIFDSDWNPQCDLQAQDRCHRFGQTKPVIVYRIVTRDSIDEKVVSRANAKRKLEKMIMMKGRFCGNERSVKAKGGKDLILEHLEELLKSMDQRECVLPQEGRVFTEEQLAILMDRSLIQVPEASNTERCYFKVINTENVAADEDTIE